MSRDLVYLLALQVWFVCTSIRNQPFSQYRRPHVWLFSPFSKCKFNLRSGSIFVSLRRNEKRGPLIARLHERDCMRTVKIGSDLRLVQIHLSEAAVEASGEEKNEHSCNWGLQLFSSMYPLSCCQRGRRHGSRFSLNLPSNTILLPRKLELWWQNRITEQA